MCNIGWNGHIFLGWLKPQFYIPTFCIFCNCAHISYVSCQMPVRIMLTRFTPSYVVLLKCKIEGFNIMSLFGSAMGCCNLHSQILCLQGLRNTNKRFSHSNLQLGQKSIGCGRNSELIINKNNILLKVIDTSFNTLQFTMVLNFFFLNIVSLFVYNVF